MAKRLNFQRKLDDGTFQENLTYDGLTGLPNRQALLSLLNPDFTRRLGATVVALVVVDVDRFRNINVGLGQDVGDTVLRELARRLLEVDEEPIVARSGDDEFTLLFCRPDGDFEFVSNIVLALLHKLSPPIRVRGQNVFVSASIGYSRCESNSQGVGHLLQEAGAAVYQAKEQGGNTICAYRPRITSHGFETFHLESRLRMALTESRLHLEYQPKIDFVTGKLTGVEALLRFVDPVLGHVPPSVFIPLAEQNGLILSLGEWVLREACTQFADWQMRGVQIATVAVNLSAVQLRQPNLVLLVKDVLDDCGILPQSLELELTENSLMENVDDSMAKLNELALLGTRLSIDDFGTGYSSLSYLSELPVHAVKIDRSFIKGIPENQRHAEITRVAVGLAHTLGLKVIAEGIETALQREFLEVIGADEGQGYLFGKPMTPDALLSSDYVK